MLNPAELARLRRQAFWSRLLSWPTYAFIVLVGRWGLRYSFRDLKRLRAEVIAAIRMEVARGHVRPLAGVEPDAAAAALANINGEATGTQNRKLIEASWAFHNPR